MDAKVFRMAILMIISAFVLVLVIVYATNVDKLSGLIGGGKEKSGSESTQESSASETVDDRFSATQIGDNLSGFELDEDFFDPTERVPTVVIRKKNTQSGDEAVVADAGFLSSEDEDTGTGMAIVGQLVNPNLEAGYYSTGNFDPYASFESSFFTDSDGAMGEAGGVSTGATAGSDASAVVSVIPGNAETGITTDGTGAATGSDGAGLVNTGSVSASGTSNAASGASDSAAGYLSSSTATYDGYIPSSQTITGTPVGIP